MKLPFGPTFSFDDDSSDHCLSVHGKTAGDSHCSHGIFDTISSKLSGSDQMSMSKLLPESLAVVDKFSKVELMPLDNWSGDLI